MKRSLGKARVSSATKRNDLSTMTSIIVGIDHLLLGMFFPSIPLQCDDPLLNKIPGTQELVLAIPHLIRPILLTFALFFAVCVFMCAVAYAFIAVKSSLHTIVKDSDDVCSRWMRRIVASDGFIEIGVLGYVFVVAFGVGRGLDLVLGVCW